MSEKVLFRRDDGTTIKIDASIAFERMEYGGFLALDDGEVVRKVQEPPKPKQRTKPKLAILRENLNDSLGVTKHVVEGYREDARRNGFKVDWVEDKGPTGVEGFLPLKGSPKEIARYEKYRHGQEGEYGSEGGGSVIYADELEAAQRLVRRRFENKEAA